MFRKFLLSAGFWGAVTAALLSAGCNGGGENVDEGGRKPDDSGVYDDRKDLFEIEVSRLSATNCVVTVYPKEQDMTYIFGVVETALLDEQYGGNAANMLQTAILNPIADQIGNNISRWSEVLATGDRSEEYVDTFVGENDYTVLVAGCSFGVRTTDVYTLDFTTPSAYDAINTFEITEDHGIVRVIPRYLDWYWWNGVLLGIGDSGTEQLELDFDSMTDEEIITYYNDYYGGSISYTMLSSGESFIDMSSWLTEGKTYTIVAFGYDGRPTGDGKVARFTFTFEGIDRTRLTTLTGDHVFDSATSLTMTRGRLADVPNVAHWDIMLEDQQLGGEVVQTSVLTELGAEAPVGTFEMPYDWVGEPGYALSGTFAFEYFLGTWWYDYDESGYFLDGRAIADTGTVKIEREGNTYNVRIEFKDPKGNTVTCLYNGRGTILSE